MTLLSIAIAQVNPTVGDFKGNASLMLSARQGAASQGADLVVFPELSLAGYPPEDLVLKPSFIDQAYNVVQELVAVTRDGGPGMVIGAPWRGEDGRVYNAAILIDSGDILGVRYKHHLPNYRVFDEVRLFAQGPVPGPLNFRGVRLGIMVCEDCWYADVAETLAETGAEILIVPNASPFEEGKHEDRMQQAVARVTETGLPFIYVNQIGGQDDLIFDGGSFVLNADRSLALYTATFVPAIAVSTWRRSDNGDWRCEPGTRLAPPDRTEAIYRAATLGVRDYVEKNGAPGVIIGLSGGIDSALTAAIAVDALGPERVRAVMMPSPYTAQQSLDDATALADALEIRLDSIGIEPAMDAFGTMLDPLIGNMPRDVTEENIQSRSRGLLLMALSNKLGLMVLTTGNKSEMAVGYATLYGDMCGAYNPLKDIYKTDVFRLARWRNAHAFNGGTSPASPLIPVSIIERPPTAELRPDQRDEDSLPPYDVLDDILYCLIERDLSAADITKRGHDHDTVYRVWRLLDRAEYKRFQAPPGAKVSRRAFGKERRYPLTNRFLSMLGDH